MALIGLKLLAGVAAGVKKIAGNIKARKEAKIQKRIDAAVNKQTKLDSLFGGMALPDSNALKTSAENLLGIKPEVATNPQAEGTVLGGSKNLPTWLLPVLGLLAVVFVLPKLMRRRK